MLRNVLARVTSDNCGTPWSQTFSFDPFGNVSKSGSITFQPGYNSPKNQYTGVTYDADGEPSNDGFFSYTWDLYGGVKTIGTLAEVHDALGRIVEQQGSTNTELVYAPDGQKLALMTGQVLSKAYVPLPGGAKAVYNSGGLAFYRHPDWLSSSRLASTPSRSKYFDVSYAAYGEDYNDSGTTDLSFAGMNQDLVAGMYDGTFRQYHPRQGRWISPDPAGLAAANPANPQSWNRYAYVANNPLSSIDPLGLYCIIGCDDGGGGGGAGGCDPEYGCIPPCDPIADPFCAPGPIVPPGDGGEGGGGVGGGGAPPQPQRKGGVWPNNETLGLPSGLNLKPATLADLLGLSPGTQYPSSRGLGPCGEFGLP